MEAWSETSIDGDSNADIPKATLLAMKAALEEMGSRDVTSQYLGKALIAPGFLQKHLEKER